uniref:Uncharacterized protein n=1 Tax=Rhizophora mucronata TaxID=61149 RepID=A0A2P2QQG7_RHIMU
MSSDPSGVRPNQGPTDLGINFFARDILV